MANIILDSKLEERTKAKVGSFYKSHSGEIFILSAIEQTSGSIAYGMVSLDTGKTNSNLKSTPELAVIDMKYVGSNNEIKMNISLND